jgi:hypothetical protein
MSSSVLGKNEETEERLVVPIYICPSLCMKEKINSDTCPL